MTKFLDGAIIAGSTDVSLLLVLPTSVTSASSGVSIAYTRTGAAAVTGTVVSNTPTGTHADWSIVPCDATNLPELHRVDLPDAAFAAGADAVIVTVRTAAMGAQHFSFPLAQPSALHGQTTAGTLTTTRFSTGLTIGTNQLARRILEFVSGACVGQRVAIVANTSGGILDIAPPLTVAPSVNDSFVVM